MRDEGVSLHKLIRYYLSRWFLIVSGVVVGALIGVLVYTPMYESKTTMILADRNTQDTALINSYLKIMKSRRVLESVIEKTSVDRTYEQLVGAIEANSASGTYVIDLAVTLPDAKESQAVAGAITGAFRDEVRALYGLGEAAEVVRVVDEANLPGTMAGMSVGIVAVISAMTGGGMILLALFVVYDLRGLAGRIIRNRGARVAVENEEEIGISVSSMDALGMEEKPKAEVVIRQRAYLRDMPFILNTAEK